jgi:putative spermidine/putrescine transport system substrate-binding protein
VRAPGLGRNQARPDLPRGQAGPGLRLPVLLDHHGLAVRRQGAQELAGILYPLDLDVAFGALEKIKDSVAVWWQAGAQPPQLLKDGEVQYAVAWSGRVAGQEGIGFSFNQGQLDLSFFAVPKGCDPAQKEAAMGLLHEMTVAKNQAAAAEVVSYTGNSPDLEPLLPQDKLDQFPTTAENKRVQVLADARWWFENADEIQTRWQEFKLDL